MKPEVWAAVCGAVRDDLDVSLIMDYLLHCRAQGIIKGIVFSTWTGELEKTPQLKQRLNDNAVTIIETTPIDDRVRDVRSGSVNFWRQAIQLQKALDVIPADAIVLKTRTDRAVPATRKLVDMLADEEPLPAVAAVEQAKDLTAFPVIFSHQIAIFRARTSRAFQFTDFAFMGYSVDLRKLLNFDITELSFSRYLVANILFFIYPFIRDYPIIKDYGRRIKFEALIQEMDRYTSQGGTVFPKFLERFYAVYFGILATHFRIGTLRPNQLGPVELPIEFSDFFHGTHNHHLAHSNLGTLINSAQIVDEFVAQPTDTVDSGTRRVLELMHTATPATFERATPQEVVELKVFAGKPGFAKTTWLSRRPQIQKWQPEGYLKPLEYHFPGITAEQSQSLWEACSEVESTNELLLQALLTYDVDPKWAYSYLSSGAKDGSPLSILTMMRLLRAGAVPADGVAELLRVNNTQAKLNRQHNAGNVRIACYVINRYLYLKEQGQPIPREVDLDLDYYLQRYMTPQKATEVKLTLYQHPEDLPDLFDAEIARVTKPVVHRRLIELALELTGRPRYWACLQPLFTDHEALNQGLYRYAIQHGLLLRGTDK